MIFTERLVKVANSVLLAACTVMSAAMDSASGDFHTARLSQIKGDAGKTNDIVFCGHRRPADSNVIFFTGDVQVRLNVIVQFLLSRCC